MSCLRPHLINFHFQSRDFFILSWRSHLALDLSLWPWSLPLLKQLYDRFQLVLFINLMLELAHYIVNLVALGWLDTLLDIILNVAISLCLHIYLCRIITIIEVVDSGLLILKLVLKLVYLVHQWLFIHRHAVVAIPLMKVLLRILNISPWVDVGVLIYLIVSGSCSCTLNPDVGIMFLFKTFLWFYGDISFLASFTTRS
jgi:hypothetical protein